MKVEKLNNYRKIITMLYDECFPEKSFLKEFLSWRKSAQVLFIVLVTTSPTIGALMSVQKWRLAIFVLVCLVVSFLALVCIMKRDMQTSEEYLQEKNSN